MTLLLDSALRISVLLVVGLTATALMRRQSAAARHWVLAVAMACAAAMPLLALVVPTWRLPVSTAQANVRAGVAAVIVSEQLEPPRGRRVDSDDRRHGVQVDYAVAGRRLAGMVWAAGVFVTFGTLLAGVVRLATLRARARTVAGTWSQQALQIARAYGIGRPVALLETDHPALLVTWGTLRPTVMLPATATQWSADRIRVVLSHELAHVRRGDWVVQMLAELLRAVFWFNPLVWLTCRRLRLESEYACDDMVLDLGVNRTDYAAHLLDLARALSARGAPWLPAPAIARPSTLQRRIRAMLTPHVNRSPLGRSMRVAAVVVLFGTSLPLAGFGGQPFGSLAGTIGDAQGGLLPDATLTLSNVASQTKHEVRSDAAGHFAFVGLLAGNYELTVESRGFSPLRETLTLAPGQVLHRALTLQIGTVQERITVTYDATNRQSGNRSASRATTAPRPSTPCTPSSIGGRITPPLKLRDVRPRVSRQMIDERIEGQVVLEAVIGTDGTVKEVGAVGPVDRELEAAATTAVRQWEFSPTTLNCVPVEVQMTVTVNFTAQL